MNPRNKVKKSLRVSFIDGIFGACMGGLISDYITPYALALKATTSQIGMLSAAPGLASSLVQLKSAELTERLQGRKRAMVAVMFFHTLMILPVVFIPYLFKSYPVYFLILFVMLYTCLNALASPLWSSLMAEYVPANKRGHYFGWRNKVLGVVTVGASFVSGFILNHFKQANPLTGFLIIFAAAFICRCFSWYYMTQMYEPAYRVHRDSVFSFFDFLKRARESNFARFVIFVSSLTFCVNVAAPFFSVFMLRDLHFSYLTYTVLVTSVTVAQLCSINRWGRHADVVGNVKVMKFTSFFIASLPLWWLLNRHPLYLIFVQALGGFAWAGFNLCASNFIYDAVSAQKRVRCIAYFNVLSGVASFIGASLGGFLLTVIPDLFGYKILTLFVIASCLRFMVVSFFYGKIKEVRPTAHISSKDLFNSMIGIRPLAIADAGKQPSSVEEE